MSFAKDLRDLADKFDAMQTVKIDYDGMTVTEAVKTLRTSLKSGTLKLEIEWSSYEDVPDVEWTVIKSYKDVARGSALAGVIREAVEKNKPHDVLERLEGDLGKGEVIPDGLVKATILSSGTGGSTGK